MAPQIRDYTAQVDTLRPSETGVEALAMEGRRIGAFADQAANTMRQAAADQARAAEGVAAGAETKARSFSGIARSVAEAGDQAGQYITHQEISHGAASFAQLHSDLTDAWNNTSKTADPNDVSIAGKFREETLEPALERFTGSFSTTQGQQWAENHAAALRDHMFEKQSATMSNLAKDAVTSNIDKMSNAWSNTARNDPTAVPFLLRTVDSSLAGVIATSPNLSGIDASKLHNDVAQKKKEDIVRAGAMGAIERSGDPEAAAAAFAKRYPDYVNAQEIDQFAKIAKQYNRLNQEGDKAAQTEAKRQATAAFHKDANQWELSTLDESGNAVLPPNAVQQLKDMAAKYGENADPGRVTAMVHRVQELGKILDPASAANLKKTSDTTERGLYTQMVLPAPGAEPLSEAQINGAYSKGQLSYAARNRLLNDFQDDRAPGGEALAKDRADFFRNFASTIDPGRDQATGAGASALGSQKIGEAQQEARRMEGVLRKQGKDPHSLYDPKSPDYFGNTVTKFRPTLAEKAAFDAQLKSDQAGKPGDSTGPVKVTTPADAAKLAPGTHYIRPDGREYVR